jgi:hypothetical protein
MQLNTDLPLTTARVPDDQPGTAEPRRGRQPLPNFLYIGASKAGSTWIFEALKAHPEVFVPLAKDLYYFSRYYERGIDWYRGFFRDARAGHKAIGELSISYLIRDKALRRIGRDLPDARILMSLRNPIGRAWSAYTFLRRNNTVSVPFREAIDEKIAFLSETGHYARHLANVDTYLTHNDIKIMLYDDLKADPHAFAGDVYRFLDVDPGFDYAEAERNALPASAARNTRIAALVKRGSRVVRDHGLANLVGRIKSSPLVFNALYKPVEAQRRERMSDDDWNYLVDLYGSDIEEVARRLDRDLSHWLIPPWKRS